MKRQGWHSEGLHRLSMDLYSGFGISRLLTAGELSQLEDYMASSAGV